MSEIICIEPVWHFPYWFQMPIFSKGEKAFIEKVGMCLFLEDCWAPLAEEGLGDRAFAKVKILCANNEIEELEECVG